MLQHSAALGAEAADGAGVPLARGPAGGPGQGCDPAEQSRGLGLQLERQVVENADTVFYGLLQHTGRQRYRI